MVGKRVQLDDATWEALAAVARDKNLTQPVDSGDVWALKRDRDAILTTRH
jgi:hypothetical protein